MIHLVIFGLIANLVLAVVKIVAGLVGNTYALIADGIESTLDIFSSIIVYSGMKIGAQPPDSDHPFGHGKAESLAAMVVALGLIFASIVIAFASFKEIYQPTVTPAPFTLIVLIGVVIVKEIFFRLLHQAGKKHHSLVVQTDAWHHRSDALTSLAAFVGIALSLTGHKIFVSADDWAAIAASGLIAFNGINLLKQAIAEIMDGAVDPVIIDRIRQCAMNVSGVLGIEKCKVRKSGPTFFVEIHIEVDPQMTVKVSHDLGHQVKDVLLRASLAIADVVVHIEPKR